MLTTPAEMNALARRLGMEDDELIHALTKREQLIETLLREEVTSIEDVQERVFAAEGYEVVGE